MFEPFIRLIQGSVTLKDARTTHSFSEVLTLKLSFVDDDLQEHRASDSSVDNSGPIDDIAYESYDDGFDNVTIPDPVDSDLWIEQWDIREEEEQLSHGHSNDCSTSGENSDIEVVMYYDSGDESIISSSDSSNEDMPVV